jgi:dolichol-phosphate mannosyltransferase
MAVTGQDVQRIYSNRFSEADCRAKARVWGAIVRGFFQKWVQPTDTVLDLGCGYGEFLNHVRALRRIGVDLNPDTARFLDPGVEFHQHSTCELPFLADATVDLVFTSNLLEHLPDKAHVEAMPREMFRVLTPGGHAVLMGPNLRLLPGEYWDFWDHVVPITDRSLVEVLGSLGFEIVDRYPRFLPYTTRSALPQAPWLVLLYLKLPLVWRVLGKQFLVRARKPA